jgi:hypothetical protein
MHEQPIASIQRSAEDQNIQTPTLGESVPEEQGVPTWDETHYWSEYRRSYEQALRHKMEMERLNLKNGAT